MPQGTTRTQPASLSFLFASLFLLSFFCSLHPLCSSLCPPLCEYSSSSSSSSYFTSLVFFLLYLCTQPLFLFQFVPFCGFTSRPDFTNGHTVPFWGNVSHVVPSFPSRKESCFGVAAPPRKRDNRK